MVNANCAMAWLLVIFTQSFEILPAGGIAGKKQHISDPVGILHTLSPSQQWNESIERMREKERQQQQQQQQTRN